MTTLTLTDLPPELFNAIIPHTLPEGFESLALTCKSIYTLCTPFIEDHHKLRSQFQDAWYGVRNCYKLAPNEAFIAWDKIVRIANNPIMARYIRNAHFERDNIMHSWSWFSHQISYNHDTEFRNAHWVANAIKLFASSPYLKQAGINWREFYSEIQEDVAKHRYSQNAAAFLLTLLPNVRTLTLPIHWKPNHKTEKLLEVIIRETNMSISPWDRPSLAQLRMFQSNSLCVGPQGFDSKRATPFMALPHMREFHTPGFVGRGDPSLSPASKDPYLRYGETLETVSLWGFCTDEVAIADFLKQTPRLKRLKYLHETSKDTDHQDWDICKFVMAIQQEAGNRLEELSVQISDLDGPKSLSPGKASLRKFQRLEKLTLPLALAMCNVNHAASRVSTKSGTSAHQVVDEPEPFIGDIVPASVYVLSLESKGTDSHEDALKVMFRDFAAKKDSLLPALKEIHVDCPIDKGYSLCLYGRDRPSITADDAYQKECQKLVMEVEKTGVVVKLHH